MLFTRARQTASAALVLVALLLHPTHAQDAARGAALFAEARKAIGGDDKLAAIKRLQVSGTLPAIDGAGSNHRRRLRRLHRASRQYRKNELTGFAGANVDRTEALNGTDVWDDTAGGTSGGRPFGGGGGFRAAVVAAAIEAVAAAAGSEAAAWRRPSEPGTESRWPGSATADRRSIRRA